MTEQQPKPSLLERLDFFAFESFPVGKDYSTKRSRYGTLIFFSVYFAYMIYIFISFFLSNAPTINQYTSQLDNTLTYTAPDLAFAFVTGDNLNMSIYDPKQFTFAFEQVTVYQNSNIPRNYTSIPMSKCSPDWLDLPFDVLCPSQSGIAQGLLYGSPVNMYPRMKISMCNNATMNNSCANQTDIKNTLMTGRLFVFIKQSNSYDYTKREYVTGSAQFASFYYFIVFDQYNRAEMKLQAENVTVMPDLLTSFQDQEMQNYTNDSKFLCQQSSYYSNPRSVSVVVQYGRFNSDHDCFLCDCVGYIESDQCYVGLGVWDFRVLFPEI
jgi:hypothetical protein